MIDPLHLRRSKKCKNIKGVPFKKYIKNGTHSGGFRGGLCRAAKSREAANFEKL